MYKLFKLVLTRRNLYIYFAYFGNGSTDLNEILHKYRFLLFLIYINIVKTKFINCSKMNNYIRLFFKLITSYVCKIVKRGCFNDYVITNCTYIFVEINIIKK